MTNTVDIEVVHYGAEVFDPSKVQPIENRRCFSKPSGGFWVSPIDTPYGWKDWCEAEDFHTPSLAKSVRLRLRGDVLIINSVQDASSKLRWINSEFHPYPCFESLVGTGVDAIWLTLEGEQETRFYSNHSLYGWDCESILVLNPDCLTPVLHDVQNSNTECSKEG